MFVTKMYLHYPSHITICKDKIKCRERHAAPIYMCEKSMQTNAKPSLTHSAKERLFAKQDVGI